MNIERRYQWWGPEGITWTRWYIYKQYDTLEEALLNLPRLQKIMETKTLKAEYRIGEN